MLAYYANFIKTGDPNADGLPVWPALSAAPDQVLELGTQIRTVPDPYLALYPLIDQYQNK